MPSIILYLYISRVILGLYHRFRIKEPF
jgi:hypothetical protein